MIRTLFVEDEYFVRQGFIHSLPWAKYGMRIIGEADNGEAALEFLRDHEVDLLVTDLTMPIKSGLELLHEAKTLYPSLPAVVLTCHRDFDCVQEALRLGAVDYIVKTRLDSEEIEQSLNRIRERLAERAADASRASAGLVLVPLAGAEEAWRDRVLHACRGAMSELPAGAWFLPEPPGAEWERVAGEAASAGWAAVQVTGHRQEDSRTVKELLSAYVTRAFPYRWAPRGGMLKVSIRDAKQSAAAKTNSAEDMAEIAKHWRSYGWVFEEAEFKDWLTLVQDREPPLAKLRPLVEEAASGWAMSEGMRTAGLKLREERDFMWETWTGRLTDARGCLLRRFASLHHSREVYASALRSLDVIREALKNGLNQVEVARVVGLSRSYFSQVFKDTFGMSFNEYVRAYSISNARKLLIQTSYPIYWIAEQSGFQDERYFSRVFRESTGLLPSEYRIRYAGIRGGKSESGLESV
ncbi:helix-turn-helix domain-containing protein [Paenibacillus lycopersici]|uniref:Helix-turn-helix domain-containing protein n=1 Tax=Paenibacillus lycopersici TaxID=2704462 RepID=A0A6C0FUB4_9BACL|nr:helix-turn-helix domain-containing protein [Paenibacillus lycopersici]QHT59602.1 helix-turn-helix domain-containing protein [Paenibacillus lycopersici]